MNDAPVIHDGTSLLLYALIAIIGLIVLIARFKLNAFVALIIASIFVGVCSRMDLPQIGKSYSDGMGGVLGSIAAIIGLGTILGKLLAESGGAQVIADRLVHTLGPTRADWSMMLVALVVGIPVFFAVGLVLLIPILFAVARETKTSAIWLGIPVLAGLSVSHGLIPPHPGPMAAIGLLHADTGKTLLYSLIIGLPVAIVSGPCLTRFLARRTAAGPIAAGKLSGANLQVRTPPGFVLSLFTVLLPVLLMLMNTIASMSLPPDHRIRPIFEFLGSPIVALLMAVLFSFYSFGYARGFDRGQILKFSEECLGPVASVLLVVGAGGGFNKVLVQSGVGDAIAALAKTAPVSPLVLGWLVAALIRVATGSATVAITTAAGILAPIAAGTPGTNLELLVLAMGAGSLILSHVNDGGFWLVKEYLNLSVTETLRTWTVMETVISVATLVLVLLLNCVV